MVDGYESFSEVEKLADQAFLEAVSWVAPLVRFSMYSFFDKSTRATAWADGIGAAFGKRLTLNLTYNRGIPARTEMLTLSVIHIDAGNSVKYGEDTLYRAVMSESALVPLAMFDWAETWNELTLEQVDSLAILD